jgi:hypothetical protein
MRACTLLVLVLVVGCGDAGPVPEVEVVSSAPMLLDTASDDADDLTIVVRYRDGNADLGGGWARVVDCRAPDVVTELMLPDIASMEAIDAMVPIEGELELLVGDVGLVEPGEMPEICTRTGLGGMTVATQAIFCVVLVDAAGNESEPDCTQPIDLQ